MGTKANPGEYDCYEKALPDEPIFILMGRDPTAPTILRQWATYREAQIASGTRPQEELPQVQEARNLADEMAEWRIANDGAWRKEDEPAERPQE